jgi:pyridoxal phosphate enzyme (YggS family)
MEITQTTKRRKIVPMSDMTSEEYGGFLQKRRGEILERVEAAARRAGRDSSKISMIAVSKTVDIPEVVLAHAAGYQAFGENRPQELKRKIDGLAAYPEMSDVRFDMIGNLQTNKINQVLDCDVTLVHSISSSHLAQAVSKRAVARGKHTHALLEVNVSGEASKSGFAPAELRKAIGGLLELPGLSIEGFMTMAPAGDMVAARRTFSGLRELRDELASSHGMPFKILSCGMSDDFEIAVEEGATLLRLGRVVFDPAYALH